jgi:DNA (cytosine-5)-methyltransferase 1
MHIQLAENEMIIDSFAGGGGASTGIFMATGRHPDVAINHDPEAVAMHEANHPVTEHFCQSIYQVDPDDIMRQYKRPIGLAWFSPDCTHHSKARGGKPKEKGIRDLAWVVVHWARRGVYVGQRPRIIFVENVEEFRDWGPLDDSGQACPVHKGKTFIAWCNALRNLGYEVQHKELRACDYGAPTIRKRLFVIARCDGLPIVWPEPTHGPAGSGLLPYRTAAECIDWSLPCPSIFLTKEEGREIGVKRPLAPATMARIARGIDRYVINAARPFIVRTAHGERDKNGKKRGKGEHTIDAPLGTVTASNDYALVAPVITEHANASNPRSWTADEPLRTQCAQVKGGHFALAAATLVQTGYGERDGQAPRALDPQKPLGTVVAGGGKHALAAAFLAQHNNHGGGIPNVGRAADQPMSTLTASGSQQGVVSAFLAAASGPAYAAKPRDVQKPINSMTGDYRGGMVASSLVKLHGTCKDGQPVDAPMATIRAQGTHIAEVRAFLMAYYGNEKYGIDLSEPMRTVVSKDRFGLVTVEGEEYIIADIGMRMLSPKELYAAQGFPADYIIAPIVNGKPLSKTAQVRMCGNSVSPHPAAAIIRAQLESKSADGRKKAKRSPEKEALRVQNLREANLRKAARRRAEPIIEMQPGNELLFDFTMDNVEVERHA